MIIIIIMLSEPYLRPFMVRFAALSGYSSCVQRSLRGSSCVQEAQQSLPDGNVMPTQPAPRASMSQRSWDEAILPCRSRVNIRNRLSLPSATERTIFQCNLATSSSSPAL
jgi:hypothetical protein